MCYNLKTIYFNDPLFKTVDATYIIHLEGNGRYNDIERQLEMYHPTKIVHIVFNKGYKKCEKQNIDNPTNDLIDANKYIINHAKQYNTILVLEDDFIFNKKIKEKEHLQNIENFMSSHTHFIYRLGCIPYVQVPYNLYTNIGLCSATHCVLYSKSMRDKIKKDYKNIKDWDMYLFFKSVNYIYYIPLCYQLFPETENQKYWAIFNPILHFISKIFIELFKLLKLDTQVEPGYSIMYLTSKIIPIIILLLIWYNS